MEIYLQKNVYEAAKERVAFVYDNFKNVVVNFSGGKDSTVVLNIALEVAKEKGRLPVNLFFFDQEAEWEHNIEYIRRTMNRPDINPMWYQIPFKINNAASGDENWLHCWEDGKEWIREKEDISIKTWEPTGKEEEFYEMMDILPTQYFNGEPVAALCGMRCEESPKRKIAITEGNPCFKYVLWGEKRKRGKLDFDPIYDWTYSDVWKYIHDNKLDYCEIYNYMWQYGVPIKNMRISNVTHEQAITSLYIMQEIEGDLYNKLTKRLGGISASSQMKEAFYHVDSLPFMFHTWEEYRDFLLEKLIKESDRDVFRHEFNSNRSVSYRRNRRLYEDYCRTCVNSIMRNDVSLTLTKQFHSRITVSEWRYWLKNGVKKYKTDNEYINYELGK